MLAYSSCLWVQLQNLEDHSQGRLRAQNSWDLVSGRHSERWVIVGALLNWVVVAGSLKPQRAMAGSEACSQISTDSGAIECVNVIEQSEEAA